MIVVLGSGHERAGDMKYWCKNLGLDSVLVIPIDLKIGGYEHNWTIPSVRDALTLLVSHSSTVCVIFAFKCGPWSALHCMSPGPPPMFDTDHLDGIPDSNGTPHCLLRPLLLKNMWTQV